MADATPTRVNIAATTPALLKNEGLLESPGKTLVVDVVVDLVDVACVIVVGFPSPMGIVVRGSTLEERDTGEGVPPVTEYELPHGTPDVD